jgi:DNA-binding transcriptional LysR family regulator
MDLKWLEDFLSLCETGNFSRSAEARHITQPAFSRRIRALEAWVGLDLIDRSAYPVRLTAAGEAFRDHARPILASVQKARAEVRASQPNLEDVVRFALPHTLSLTFFPKWLAQAEKQLGPINSRLIAANLYEVISLFEEGGCDLLMYYDHPVHPVDLHAATFETITLAQEYLEPCCALDERGQPLFDFPGTPERPVPYLAFSGSAYLRRVVDAILEEVPVKTHLRTCYETDMSEAIKMMVLAGHGVAFLPASAIEREVAARQIMPLGQGQWRQPLGIRAARLRRKQGLTVERLWNLLVSEAKETARRRA